MELSILNVPDNKIKQLNKKNIFSVEDLLSFYPKKYDDLSRITPAREYEQRIGENITVKGIITEVSSSEKVVKAFVQTEADTLITVLWFNQYYIARTLKVKECEYIFRGKLQVNKFDNSLFVSPTFFCEVTRGLSPIVPVYAKIPGMSDEYLKKSIASAIDLFSQMTSVTDYIPEGILKDLSLLSLKDFIRKVHLPANRKDVAEVDKRKKVDKLFPFAFGMTRKKMNSLNKTEFICTEKKLLNRYISNLPFSLTEGQKEAINSCVADMCSGNRVDALIQGDVGSGKTVIAMAMAVFAAENGYQAAIMCPTEVLAGQHFRDLETQIGGLGLSCVLLTGSMKAAEKKKVLKRIENGDIDIVVGTHAIISSAVNFNKLGLTVVDEEHRFGVKQRDNLIEKASQGVHNISMSATPIPRSLALTLYGESTRVINIKTKPAGRKPVITVWHPGETKIYQSIYNQVKLGHQCYVVCPLIEDSQSRKLSGVDSVETTFKKMTEWFSKDPAVKIDYIAGNMKNDDIQRKIMDFKDNKTHILISTTIIEVGVNVPNATVILIKNAERFGLAQLHQLRGRIGRGQDQGYCVLHSPVKNNPRINIMVNTCDGFDIAEKDMELRGAGAILGTKQSGFDECLTSMLQNQRLYAYLCEKSKALIEKGIPLDERLKKADNN